ncbi:hypothetical protein Golax_017370, partial [Gossypium laxum]|nr:hypothetical protein [Gossypium laxum]
MPKFEKTVVGSCKLGFSNGLHDVDSLGNDSGHQFAVKYLEKITFDHSKVHSTSSAVTIGKSCGLIVLELTLVFQAGFVLVMSFLKDFWVCIRLRLLLSICIQVVTFAKIQAFKMAKLWSEADEIILHLQ